MGRPGSNILRPCIFLDRDGVVNRGNVREGRPFSPTHLDDFEILPFVKKSIVTLKNKNFLVIIVTNQPDVSTGLQNVNTVNAMHGLLRKELLVDDIKVCYCTDADHCPRRKPAPGMLLEAAEEHGIDLARSFMVGDRWRDMEAGKAAGCATVFIDCGYTEKRPEHYDLKAASLADAIELMINFESRRKS